MNSRVRREPTVRSMTTSNNGTWILCSSNRSPLPKLGLLHGPRPLQRRPLPSPYSFSRLRAWAVNSWRRPRYVARNLRSEVPDKQPSGGSAQGRLHGCSACNETRRQASVRDGKTAAHPAAGRVIASEPAWFRYVIDEPLSRFAESIRAVKVGINLSGVAKSNKVIGITSSLPNEGKSTISACLAQLAAHGGARVILVDCDLRKPALSQVLAPACYARTNRSHQRRGQPRPGDLVPSIISTFLSAASRQVALDTHQRASCLGCHEAAF